MTQPTDLALIPGNRRDLWFGLFLAAILLLVYRPAWHGSPIFDDAMRLPKPADRSLSALGRVWLHPTADHQYHPLVDTVFWMEARLFSQRMSGYHLVNIMLHASAAFLLLKILRSVAMPGACLATTVFALHPLQVESVAWLAEMKNTLSAVFLFAAVLTYLRYNRDRIERWYWLTWLFFVVGLFAKASTAYLPVCVLILEWWRRGKLEWDRDVRPMVPFFAAGIIAALTTSWFERRIGHELGTITISAMERVLIAGRAFWFYLGKIFWPVQLKMFYPRWAIDSTIWWQYLFPAAAIIFLLGAWCGRRRYRWLWGAILFFFLSLVPFLGFSNMRMFRFQFVSEHLEYLAIIGIIVPVSAGIAMTLNRRQGWRRLTWTMPVAGALAALTIQTWQHSKAFRDAESCYRESLANGGENWIADMNLGIILIAHGQPADAQVHLRRALDLNPPEVASVAGIHMDLGQALRQQRRLNEAIEEFRKSIEVWPDFQAYNALASIYHQQGNLREAIAHYRKAMELAPQSSVAMANTAWILATASDDSLRDGSKALQLALKADRLSGGVDPFAIHALAAAYAETGDYSKAIEASRHALLFATERQLPDLVNQLRSDVALYEMNLPAREAAK